MNCILHAGLYEGNVCPWCAEAAGVSNLEAWTPPDVLCVHCGHPEIRFNQAAEVPYHWCSGCGKKQERDLVFDPIKCEPLPLFAVATFAEFWTMDQHVSLPDEGGWVVRSEWNRMRRGRTHESQSWAAKPLDFVP